LRRGLLLKRCGSIIRGRGTSAGMGKGCAPKVMTSSLEVLLRASQAQLSMGREERKA